MGKRFNRMRRGVSELFSADDEEPDPKGHRHASTEVLEGNIERNRPPKDEMSEYWRVYESFPLVRESISSFAREVIEPGYYIECESEETIEELDEWLQEAAIKESETGKNVKGFLKKSVVQLEVRGTVLIEKVRGENSRKIVSVAFHNPEQFEVYTHPESNLLLGPDDDIEDAPTTTVHKYDPEEGGIIEEEQTACYVQFDTSARRWISRKKEDKRTDIKFTKDEMVKITKDADIGEVFGTSSIEAVYDRVEALRQKLQDNDAAIAHKAYPFWLFQFGTEEDPWEDDEIVEFMENHDVDKFSPKMKQGVAGNVDVKTISGDTADLADPIDYDVNHIVTGMPVPRYHLGGFAEGINQIVASAQKNAFDRKVRERRHDLEDEITPLLKEVARERDLAEVESIKFKIGRPGVNEFDSPETDNVLRYESGAKGGQQGQRGQGQKTPPVPTFPSVSGGGGSGPAVGGDGNGFTDQSAAPSQPDRPAEELGLWGEIDSLDDARWDPDSGPQEPSSVPTACPAELESNARPDLEQERVDLTRLGTNVLMNARDRGITRLERRYVTTSRQNTDEFMMRPVREAVESTISSAGLQGRARGEIESALEGTLADLEENVFGDIGMGIRHRQQARGYAREYEDAIQNLADEMIRAMELSARRGADQNQDFEHVRERIENLFTEEKIRQRAALIARMELRNAVESIKLQEFEATPGVVGYRIHNPCTEATTPLCEDLAGCGHHDPVEVHFDGDPTDQLMEATSDRQRYEGFNPIPPSPPYHWNCRSWIAPITEEE